VKKNTGTIFLVSCLLISTAAMAEEGDCDGNGKVNSGDNDALLSALNTPVEESSLANCDYNADGVIGMDDMAAHLGKKNSLGR